MNITPKLREQWFKELMNDPELGGKNIEKTVAIISAIVEIYAGDHEQTSRFREFMKQSGIGNHIALVRLVYNLGKDKL